MKYVLDASIALAWVLKNAHTPRAIQLRDEYQNGIHELIAPSHFPGEIASALTKAERQKLIGVGSAHRVVRNLLSTPPVLYATDSLFYRAIDISSQTRSAYYDCVYVALAEREGCQMVTADDKLLHNLQPFFQFVVALATLP